MAGFPEQGPSNQDVMDAISESQAKMDQGFADVQEAIMAVQQSLSMVQSSVNYIISNLQDIKASIDSVEMQITVSYAALALVWLWCRISKQAAGSSTPSVLRLTLPHLPAPPAPNSRSHSSSDKRSTT